LSVSRGSIVRVPLTLPTGTVKAFGEWFVADITTEKWRLK